MTKTRHKKLYEEMALIATNMNHFYYVLRQTLTYLPKEYYWRRGKAGRCCLSPHIKYLLNLVDFVARNIFFNFAITKSTYFTSFADFENNHRAHQAFGISRVPYLQMHEDFARKSFYQALLPCCDHSELGTHDWFQKEEACDSFSHQLRSISALYNEEFVLDSNLQRDPYPMFQDAVYHWKEDPDCPDTIENEFNKALLHHEPASTSTVAQAWEYVKKTLKAGKRRKIEKFLKLYLSLLEKTTFHQIPWSDQKKKCWLKAWEDKLFGNDSHIPHLSHGRWKQGNSINYVEAAKLISYFANNFLENPADLKSGEIACILWLMLWCAYHHLNDIKVGDVIHLTTDNFLACGKLKLREHSFKISQGLLKLLTTLFGTGTGARSKRLFTNVRNEKFLARKLKEASKIVFGHDEILITPSAFLNFPHIWPGKHLSRKERESMRNVRYIIEPQLPEKYINEAKKIVISLSSSPSI